MGYITVKKMVSWVTLTAFVMLSVMPSVSAQTLTAAMAMPAPGTMVSLSGKFTPPHLVGLTVDPKDPFKFNFIIHKGDTTLTLEQKREEYRDLVKYFLAALTVPDEHQWVNLSPYEGNRIIQDDFGLTEMGRDLLAQDYILKQITASLIHPDSQVGKIFWQKVYAKAWEKYGTSDIPLDTFNKVWIIPDKAVVYEKGQSALIVESHLKVMLESDYMAMSNPPLPTRGHVDSPSDNSERIYVSPRRLPTSQGLNVKASQGNPVSTTTQEDLVKAISRDVLLPMLEQEVNEGKNFANLRQIVSGMILATWYKKALKESILGQVYADKAKVQGVDQDPRNNQQIWEKYVEAFKKGAFNLIREDHDQYTEELIPRKYFSGGFVNPAQVTRTKDRNAAQVIKDAALAGALDFAMTGLGRITLKPGVTVSELMPQGQDAEKIFNRHYFPVIESVGSSNILMIKRMRSLWMSAFKNSKQEVIPGKSGIVTAYETVNEVVGYQIFTPVTRRHMFLPACAVRPEYQLQGVNVKLIEDVVSIARRKGYRWVTVEVDKDHPLLPDKMIAGLELKWKLGGMGPSGRSLQIYKIKEVDILAADPKDIPAILKEAQERVHQSPSFSLKIVRTIEEHPEILSPDSVPAFMRLLEMLMYAGRLKNVDTVLFNLCTRNVRIMSGVIDAISLGFAHTSIYSHKGHWKALAMLPRTLGWLLKNGENHKSQLLPRERKIVEDRVRIGKLMERLKIYDKDSREASILALEVWRIADQETHASPSDDRLSYEQVRELGFIRPFQWGDDIYKELVRNRMNNQLRREGRSLDADDRPLAVILATPKDPNGAFMDAGKHLEALIAQNYRVMYYEVANVKEMTQALEDATRASWDPVNSRMVPEQKADLISFWAHGQRTGMAYEKNVGVKELVDLKRSGVKDYLQQGGTILLNSCSTGWGKNRLRNVANFLAQIFTGAGFIYAPIRPTATINYVKNGSFENAVLPVYKGNVEGYDAVAARKAIGHFARSFRLSSELSREERTRILLMNMGAWIMVEPVFTVAEAISTVYDGSALKSFLVSVFTSGKAQVALGMNRLAQPRSSTFIRRSTDAAQINDVITFAPGKAPLPPADFQTIPVLQERKDITSIRPEQLNSASEEEILAGEKPVARYLPDGYGDPMMLKDLNLSEDGKYVYLYRGLQNDGYPLDQETAHMSAAAVYHNNRGTEDTTSEKAFERFGPTKEEAVLHTMDNQVPLDCTVHTTTYENFADKLAGDNGYLLIYRIPVAWIIKKENRPIVANIHNAEKEVAFYYSIPAEFVTVRSKADNKEISLKDENISQGNEAMSNGGIDLNQANMAMQIKRDGNGVPLPVSQQNLENIHINGLVPTILDIQPVTSLPMLKET